MKRIFRTLLHLFTASLLLVAGCATRTASVPVPSGFLTRYDQLHPVDATTWRYVDAAQIRTCRKFKIEPAQVLVKSYDGSPVGDEGRMAADYVAMALVKALSDRYQITSIPGPNVGSLRIAITGAEKRGTQLELRMEGEVLDSATHAQMAALMTSELSEEHDKNWSSQLTFRQMVTTWAADFRHMLDEVQGQ